MEELIQIRQHTVGRSREKVTGDQRTMLPVYDFADKTSPCREACPAGHDIAYAMHLARLGAFEEAHRLFLEESPFPAITGRVCYHPCETWCNRKDYDTTIGIHDIERAVAEHAPIAARGWEITHGDLPVAIVGSGPAGATAAYHLCRMGYPVTVFEKDEKPGGALRYAIPRYRLPSEVINREYDRLAGMGITFRTGVAVGRDIEWQDLLEDFAAVFLGAGLGAGKGLRTLNGAEVPCETGLAFLRDVNEGTRTTAEGTVAVIGGGDVAIDVARSALRLGAADVHLFCLETRETMPAEPGEVGEAEREGVMLHTAWALESVGDVDGGRHALTFHGVERVEADFTPVLNHRATQAVADSIISAVGQTHDAGWLPEPFWNEGRLGIDAMGRTGEARVFAGGDIAGSRNVVGAIAAGKRGAAAIDAYLQSYDAVPRIEQARVGGGQTFSMKLYRGAREDSPLARPGDVVDLEQMNLNYFPQAPRARAPVLAVRERAGTQEVYGTLSVDQLREEASRCFNCSECTVCGNCFIFCPDAAVKQLDTGFFVIDEDHCKGCGQCTAECPRSAMSMIMRRADL